MKSTDTRPLGKSGLDIGVFGLGCAPLAGLYRATSDAEAEAALRGAWDAGVRYFDTAPYYGYTRSEHRVGQVLRDYPREDFVLSTKVGRLMKPAPAVKEDNGWFDPLPFRPVYDYRHDAILRSFEDSQQRLGMDRIDILLVHDIGRLTHGEQHDHYWRQLTDGGGFRALEALRSSGQVKAVGLGVNEWEAVWDAMQAFDLDCTLLAGRYTLLEQQTLSPLLEACTARGVGILLGGPFNSGILAGGVKGNRKFNYAEAPAEVIERVAALEAVCARFDVPLPAAALQFPMAHPAVASCLPGGRSAAQLRQNIDWFERPIPPAFWQALRAQGLLDPAAPVPA